MEIPAVLTEVFPPSAELLLDCARRQTDDEMLGVIAEADYGWRAEEAMAELRPIRDQGIVPCPLPWTLSEVLSLTQFSNPEMPNAPPFQPGPTGRRGHQTRLFACAVLLRAEAVTPESEFGPEIDSALAQCLASAKVLNEELSEAAACFLTWRMSQEVRADDSLLVTLGLLILATRLRAGRFEEPSLGVIAEWVLVQESLARRAFPPGMPPPFSVQAGFWQPLVAELRTEAEAIHDHEVRTNVQLCELLLE